jgi:hypothetical protein
MPSGSPYTYVGNANSSDNTGAILTSQGTVALGGWGYFLPSEYEACIGNGLLLVPGSSGTAPGPTRGSTAYAGTDGTLGGPGGTPLTQSVVNAASSGGPIAWTADTLIPQNAIVSDAGSLYICDAEHTSASTFAADSSHFTAFGSGSVQVESGGVYGSGSLYVGATNPGSIGSNGVWINPSASSPEIQEIRFAQYALADKPVGLWLLNDPAGDPQDLSGNGNHVGTIGGTPAYSGVPGGGVEFIAADHCYFSVPTSATLAALADTVSVEAWLQPTATSSTKGILSKGSGNIYTRIELTTVGTALDNVPWLLSDGTANIASGGAAIPSDGNWHHFVVTKTGATVAMYIDGAAITIPFFTNATLTANTMALVLGADDGSGDYMDGLMRWAAIYNTALSANRVAAHYRAGTQ